VVIRLRKEHWREGAYTPIPWPNLRCPACGGRLHAPERGVHGWAFGVPVLEDSVPVTCSDCGHATSDPILEPLP
jgi:hypothetical protein